MRAAKIVGPGLACLAAATTAAPVFASLTGDWQQSASATSGYVLNQLKVQSSTDWIAGQILINLDAGDGNLLYFTPGVNPASVKSIYTDPGSSTRPYAGGSELLPDPVNSNIPDFGSLPDVASLLDNPPPASGPYLATATTKTLDLTWFGPPEQMDDVATGGNYLNLFNVTASSSSFGTWSLVLANENEADDFEVSGVIYHGRLFIEEPLLGDYNYNGVVDAADYTVWRDSFNSTSNLDADGNNNGVVDSADYTVWRDNFGTGSSSSMISEVPEPASAGILSVGLFFAARRRR